MSGWPGSKYNLGRGVRKKLKTSLTSGHDLRMTGDQNSLKGITNWLLASIGLNSQEFCPKTLGMENNLDMTIKVLESDEGIKSRAGSLSME